MPDDLICFVQGDRPRAFDDNMQAAFDTLVIGDVERWRAEGRDIPSCDGVAYLALHDLTSATLQGAGTEVVLSPLCDPRADVIEIAVRLTQCGFNGRYRAITAQLPNPDIVMQEVQDAAPEVDFDLLVVPT